jgi:hypothetical protein
MKLLNDGDRPHQKMLGGVRTDIPDAKTKQWLTANL